MDLELNLDGFRALAHIKGHRCTLPSRNGHTFKQWSSLMNARLGRRLKESCASCESGSQDTILGASRLDSSTLRGLRLERESIGQSAREVDRPARHRNRDVVHVNACIHSFEHLEIVRTYTSGFFATLGKLAKRQQENQLSRTFQACFTVSAAFRQAVFRALANTCGIKVPAVSWQCRTEVAHADGRFDIKLVSETPDAPEFILESKVGSVLSKEQLERYRTRRRGRQQHVVAITKRRPEVPKKDLIAEGFHALRWQDLHRALGEVSPRKPVDRFIAVSFMEYLESSGMAYPEQLTVEGLERASRVIRALHGHVGNDGAPAANAFRDLHTASSLLRELAVDLVEEFPFFAKRSRWGPNISLGQHESGRGAAWLRTSFWTGSGAQFRSLNWGFEFEIDRPKYSFYVERWSGNHSDTKYFWLTRFRKNGVVERELMFAEIRKLIRTWRIKA